MGRAKNKNVNVSNQKRAKDSPKALLTLLHYIGNAKILMIIAIVLAIGGTLFNIIGPKIMGMATTELFNGLISKLNNSGDINLEKIVNILLLSVALYILSSVLASAQGIMMARIANKITYIMRKDVSKKINRLPVGYFESHAHGEILSRITNDIDILQTNFSQSLSQIITSIVTLFGIIGMMFSMNIKMALISIIVLPVSLVVILIVIVSSQKYFEGQQQYLGIVNSQIEEIYAGVEVIKAYNREKKTLDTFAEENDKLYETGWKSQFYSGIMMPAMQFVGNLGYVAIALLGAFMAAKNSIELGDIQAFLQYTRNLAQPISQIAQITTMLQTTAAAAERVFDFLNEPEEQKEEEFQIDLKEKIIGNIEFQNICFGYNPEKIIIIDFSAMITAGQKVAIVGPTGAGKTTLVKLIMRYYNLNSGCIRIDGIDICDINRCSLRNLIGMVLQDTWLFNGSVMENIRYGNLEATDDEVIEAAKLAHVHKFIMEQPGGYQMILNEESNNISQGQKQLITIARAILANRKIMILDEATSSVDTRTEILIQEAMDCLMKERTSFIIAHRLSTIKNADMILVLDAGNIVEHGTHEELISNGKLYSKLYNSQFEKV